MTIYSPLFSTIPTSSLLNHTTHKPASQSIDALLGEFLDSASIFKSNYRVEGVTGIFSKNFKMIYHSPWHYSRLNITMILHMEKDTHLAELGNQIRKLRKSKGLSQEQLALNAGVDRSYIGGIERGERNVSL